MNSRRPLWSAIIVPIGDSALLSARGFGSGGFEPPTFRLINGHDWSTGLIRFAIQLRFIYQYVARRCTLGPSAASQPALQTEASRKLALPVPLQDFSRSPTHHWK